MSELSTGSRNYKVILDGVSGLTGVVYLLVVEIIKSY